MMAGTLGIHSTNTKAFVPPKVAPLGSRLSPLPSLLEPATTLPPVLCSARSLTIAFPRYPIPAQEARYLRAWTSSNRHPHTLPCLAKPSEIPTKNHLSLEKAFDLFCEGKSFYGPYLDHVLGFWKASQEKPHKSSWGTLREEGEAGAVQEIVRLCSFENPSNLDVNKTGVKQQTKAKVENNFYFRKGKAGDWKNYLTTEMEERLDKLMDQTFAGTGN
ncbi:hypothetical protein Goari_025888 [Gossypium aridum]|uniref:Sulfotransferase n=1 Tax=Gossypium aridum TaxID=34290 RepID=A0A7J8XBJ2_GOSAI|nr:hypothetical protein [Gossypium aridum]